MSTLVTNLYQPASFDGVKLNGKCTISNRIINVEEDIFSVKT